jgi:hypothetical protein
MCSTMNPLFVIGESTVVSAMTCQCQDRHSGSFHQDVMADLGRCRRNCNLSLVGVS